MRPNQLEHIYHQYKHDTKAVALWLASTAKICGYPEDLLASKSWGVLHSRLDQLKEEKRKKNGRGRKLSPSSPRTQREEHILALDDILPLAKFIAQRTDPTVSMPEAFSQTLDRLISLRTKFSQMKTITNTKADSESDRNHGFFVGVLKNVRETLRPAQRFRGRTNLPRLSRRLLMRIF
ncbi:unnamed protein product [Clonostachys solani]|uniref:DUF6604 domain-containing protein n=1 Tax=Clonostachys solani TaxID=160281 RepID=A0A9P0EKC5_9HYPO|nr:unnamed protein product [Clonostachys solani]